MPDTSLVHGSISSLHPDDALPFARDTMLELIEQVSGRSDKSLVLRAIVILVGIVFVWQGQPKELSLPLWLTLLGTVVGYVINSAASEVWRFVRCFLRSRYPSGADPKQFPIAHSQLDELCAGVSGTCTGLSKNCL